MGPARKEEPAGGGRAKGKKKPLPLRYSRFVRAIELYEMARDDMDNQSLITHLVISQYRLSSRSSSRLCVSLSSRSRYLSSRLPVSSRSSCYCVSFLSHSSSFSFVPRNWSSIYPQPVLFSSVHLSPYRCRSPLPSYCGGLIHIIIVISFPALMGKTS